MSPDRSRRWRGVGFRLAAILLGFLPFVAAEAILRWSDYPKSANVDDPFLDLGQLESLFELDADGRHYRIPERRLRLFAEASFPARKPASTKRIFALGGSTTQGEPYGPPTAFPQWMAINLELVDPSQQYEVINCGGLSYASYRVLPILREVLRYEPDLIVLYCGQNEFLEARELTGWKHVPPIATHMMSWLSRSRIVQATSQWASPSEFDEELPKTRLEREVDALLDSKGGLEKYRRASLDHAGVVASYRWNMQEMIRVCQAAQVPLLMVVPTVNLVDTPPLKVEPSPELSEPESRELTDLWSSIQSRSLGRDQLVIAARRILEIDPQHAGAHYLLGRQAFADREKAVAEMHLVAAKDFDVCPLRATTAIQETVRELAALHRVPYVDADLLFRQRSSLGLVGNQWLVDHVHPTIEGHQVLGEAIAEELLAASWIRPANPIGAPGDQAKGRWVEGRTARYRQHLANLDEAYYFRGKQRLEGLLLWTQGRANQLPLPP